MWLVTKLNQSMTFSVLRCSNSTILLCPGCRNMKYEGISVVTKQIIDLLNIVRTDFSQDWLNGSERMIPELLVGDMLNCYQQSIEKCGTDEIQSLAFQNILANSMRKKNGAREVENILEMDFDSNAGRQMVIKALIKSCGIYENE